MATTYEPIATTTLGSATGTVTFTSISGSFTDLIVVINAAHDTSGRDTCWRVNNDTGNNYSRTEMNGDGSSALSSRSSNNDKFFSNGLGTSTALGVSIIHIMNYANTTTYKTALSRNNRADAITQAQVHLWRSTSAINRLDFFPNVSGNFLAGSTFTIYGIASA